MKGSENVSTCENGTFAKEILVHSIHELTTPVIITSKPLDIEDEK